MGRDVALERAWKGRVREYERSGLTIREFCQREGVVDHQLNWWRRELKRRAAEKRPTLRNGQRESPRRKQPRLKQRSVPPSGFVPVEVEVSGPGHGSVEITLEQPPRIKVSPGCDVALLQDVLRILETR